MKRALWVLVLLVLLVLLAMFGYWQRGWLWEKRGVLAPFSQAPRVYELASLLEKEGFTIPAPPQTLGDTIQASLSGVTVLFSAQKDLSSQVRSLQLVLPKSKMGAKQAKEIDLRFNKIIIRYQE